jgi:hypothetical protein
MQGIENQAYINGIAEALANPACIAQALVCY